MATLKDTDKKYLLDLKPEDITFNLLLDLFADSYDKKTGTVSSSRIHTEEETMLEAGEYFNKEKVRTNAGQIIYNKLIIERDFGEVVGYVSKPINGKVLAEIEDKLSNALLNDKITTKQMADYLNRTQWLAMQLHTVISGSFTMPTLKPSKKVMAERERLLKTNKTELDKGDVITAAKIEKQLLDMADKELAGDSGMDLYKSGARGSFGNNFKTTSVMKGPVFNPSTGEFDIVTTNYMEGIRKEDIPVFANAIITGAYPKAIGTATSGYFSKQIIAALQAVKLDVPGSECGTKGYLNITISPVRKKDFLYRYVIEGSKLVLIDDTNIDKYVNKPIKLRSPMYCIGEDLCSKCAGIMYEKLEIRNAGLTASRASSSLLNLSMKKFHDTSSKIYEIKQNTITI